MVDALVKQLSRYHDLDLSPAQQTKLAAGLANAAVVFAVNVIAEMRIVGNVQTPAVEAWNAALAAAAEAVEAYQ
jgi:hypothetical protein